MALMRQNSKRTRQLIRDSIHLPFYERINSRNGSTTASSDVDPMDVAVHKLQLGAADVDRIDLSDEIVDKCKKAFFRFDTDNNGFIDMRELTVALVSMGYNPTEQELRAIMDDVDQNGDDKLDLLEFLRVIQRQKNSQTHALTEKQRQAINIREAWKSLSDAKTGRMNIQTFRQTLESFDLAIDVDALIKVLDADKSGFVDFEEFHALFAESH